MYSVLTSEASYNLTNYKETQHTISPFMPRWLRSLPLHEGVCQHLTYDKTSLPTPEVDPDDLENLLSAELDDPVWSKMPLSDIQEYQCMHQIPRPATPPSQPNEVEMPATPPL